MVEFILLKNESKIKANVYDDDTIEMVCYKLSVSLRCNLNDLYLFTRQRRTYNASQLFDKLNETFKSVEKFHLQNFMENLNRPLPTLSKSEYEESDLPEYDNVLMDVPIGQTMDASVNPYRVHSIEKYMHKTSTLRSQSLLLDYMPFYEDQVFVCLKSDFTDQYGIYFNHQMDATRMESQSKLMDDIFDLPAPTGKGGITAIVCKLNPMNPILVPLDTIFNLLHVSDDIPMIQYNTGDENTTLYKLLSHEEDIKGNKIPVLEKNKVLKHDQSYKNSVTVFFQELKYAFLGNGSIILEAVCKSSTVEEVDAILKGKQYLLDQVGNFMYQSGYNYPKFVSVYQSEILKMDITLYFENSLKVQKAQCNPFFIDMEEDEKRYKRVSMFNENTLIQEICIQGMDHVDKTVAMVSSILNVPKMRAKEIVEGFNAQMENALLKNKNKKISVKEKTGFPTTVKIESTRIVIYMKNINSIYYLSPVQKNMAAYVAILTSPTNLCKQVKEQTEINYDYEYYTNSDSDEEFVVESDTSDSDDEFVIEGGAIEKNAELIMKYPNFLIHRIKTLYKKQPADYTRKCPRSRMPVALNGKEAAHEKVQQWKEKFVSEGITYVCPSYWDVENKVPLHKDEIVGKKLIDKKLSTEVNFEKDGTVIQIQDMKNGVAKYPYPNLMIKPNGQVNGPCCFIKKEQKHDVKEKHEAKQHIITDTSRLASQGRVSYLPQPIRYFFNLPDNCELETGRYLLRYGVKENRSTFMDCIEVCTSIIFPKYKSRETILKAISQLVEKGFDTYNNGNLKQFKTEKNFISLIPEMDYTYLWEIICDFFKVNLVILRVPNDENIEIVCPSNHYSTRKFDPHKKSLIIIEHNSGFEPIIEHDVVKNYHNLLHDFTTIPLQKVASLYEKCTSINQRYTTNVIAQTMYVKLKKYDPKQVVKNGKCIGFSVESVFIPCYPSAVLSLVQTDMPVNTYAETQRILTKHAKTVPCKPMFKVVEKEHIQGIITETNNFVECTPEKDHETDLPMYTSHVLYEYETFGDTQDAERVSYTKKSKVEKYLYAACRRLLKEIVSKDAGLRKRLKGLIREKKVSEKNVQDILGDQVHTVDKLDDGFIKEQLRCRGYCYASDKLIIPRYNLVDGKMNRYFYRLANELNHYARISTFVTKSQLRIPDLPFSVNDNEVLLMGFMVEAYYKELMEPKRLSKYYSTYDNANPTVDLLLLLKVVKLGYIKI